MCWMKTRVVLAKQKIRRLGCSKFYDFRTDYLAQFSQKILKLVLILCHDLSNILSHPSESF